MFLRKAALRPVPKHAVVQQAAVGHVEAWLDAPELQLQEALDSGFRELDRKQPALAGWLATQVAAPKDELAQSLGYFLAVTVYLAFREAFPKGLEEADQTALELAIDTLTVDEQLRASDPLEVLESDDVVAMGQPEVLDYVQHHLREAITQAGEEANLDDIDHIYRAILVEVITLSHAVAGATDERSLA